MQGNDYVRCSMYSGLNARFEPFSFWPIATLPQEFMSAMPESGQIRTDVNDRAP
jgi:hypothetical protein